MGQIVIDSDEQREDIERTAAEWLVRLGGEPLNSAERATFDELACGKSRSPCGF